ncbi:MAG: NAD(P)-binding domain-containing protein [bacterium]|nr:NAD(P)-binding domain-containing protein [bacterium]
MSSPKVCIIGAGSSGIGAAKVLQQHGVPFDCFEKGSGIGGNWRYRNDNGQSAAYASLHLNTSKSRMAYSDFPMPEEYPDYPHHSQILRYFEDYVDHFDVRRHIRFSTTVSDVHPTGDGEWDVTLDDSETRAYAAVVVSNGHHWNPRLPDFPGSFDGRARHSHEYETSEGLEGRNVLVVGIGNSGVDIASEASRVARRTFLSTRRSAHILPKYALGKPIDLYTTPGSSRLPLTLQKLGFEALLRLACGPQATFGVPKPEHSLLQAHPTVSADLLNLVGHGKIRMKPDVEELRGDRVAFADGSVEPIDEIIYATGYRISFPFFRTRVLAPQANEVRFYRHVVPPHLPNLYFIGLIQPLGAIMPLAEEQSIWVAKLLTGECSLPDRRTMEHRIERDLEKMHRRYVTSKRHTIQVDYFPYRALIRREVKRGRKLAVSGSESRRVIAPEAVASGSSV